MANYVVIDKDKLESDLTIVADSIRSKANITEKLEFPLGYKSVVDSINNSGNGDGIDTSELTATASDLAAGVKAIGLNGAEITGELPVESNVTLNTMSIGESNGSIVMSGKPKNKGIYNTSTIAKISASFANFGTATEDKVLEGVTYTGADGFKKTGKMKASSGINTSDATVTAQNLEKDVVAYGANGRVVGEVRKVSGLGNFGITPTQNGDSVNLQTTIDEKTICDAGTKVTLSADLSEFGTAALSDVSENVSFTSSNGLKVTGSLKEKAPSNSTATVTYGEATLSGYTVKSIHLQGSALDDVICRKGQSYSLSASASDFGDAKQEDVLEGKTFTSINGLKLTGTAKSGGVTIPDGAIVIQKVIGEEASTQIGSGYSISITYGDDVEISDSFALAFVGTTKSLSNVSTSTDFSVLYNKYVRVGTSYSTTGTFYYIPNGAEFTVEGQTTSKKLNCTRAQSVTIQKVTL